MLKILANAIYFIFKLLPIKNKVVFISRFNDKKSIDFLLLEEKIKEIYPQTKIVILNHKMKHKITYIFYVLKEMYHLATSKGCIIDSYIIPVSILKHKKELIIIQIWHALGAIKKFGHAILDKEEGHSKELAKLMNMHKNYNYVICSGKGTVNHYVKAFNIEVEKIKIYSLPRVNYLLDELKIMENQKAIYNKYPQLRDKKNILYVPTFRVGKDLEIDELINSIDFAKYNLVIKKHPNDQTKIINNNNIIIDESFNYIKFLGVSDYIITDYSAIAFEAAFLGKPIYFYVYDISDYKHNRGLNIDLNKELPNCVFEKASNLINTIESGIYDYEQLLKFKNKYIENNQSNLEKIIELFEVGEWEYVQDKKVSKEIIN